MIPPPTSYFLAGGHLSLLVCPQSKNPEKSSSKKAELLKNSATSNPPGSKLLNPLKGPAIALVTSFIILFISFDTKFAVTQPAIPRPDANKSFSISATVPLNPSTTLLATHASAFSAFLILTTSPVCDATPAACAKAYD